MKFIWIFFALPVLSAIPVHAAEPPTLGRLFNTPEERRMLDQQREETTEPSGKTTLNGVVQRSGGGGTRWLNQEMQHHKDAPTSRHTEIVQLPGNKSLRVGESSHGEKRQDLLDAGAIRVIPATPNSEIGKLCGARAQPLPPRGGGVGERGDNCRTPSPPPSPIKGEGVSFYESTLLRSR